MDTDTSPRTVSSWRLSLGPDQTTRNLESSGVTSGPDPLAVNVTGTRGLTTRGQIFELASGDSTAAAFRSLAVISGTVDAPLGLGDPRYMAGFHPTTGELLRYDVIALTRETLPGYSAAALGAARVARLLPLGDGVVVGTSQQRLVIVPLP
ncbi:MAG: hypothetical protein M9894_37230 [Planctomycetes bacterium]|nr:hypothetical protein [Planctomycetota bacterium]